MRTLLVLNENLKVGVHPDDHMVICGRVYELETMNMNMFELLEIDDSTSLEGVWRLYIEASEAEEQRHGNNDHFAVSSLNIC